MSVNLFDTNFYRANNSDLVAAGLTTDAQLLSHFQNIGIDERRVFSPIVNLNFYRSSNSDLGVAGLRSDRQLFDHLQNHGIAEGRQFSSIADLNFYRSANSDLTNLNNEQLFNHLVDFGISEKRSFSQFFDINYYTASNPNLASANLDANSLLQHFLNNGLTENRLFSNAFDVNYYRSTYSDLLSANLNNKQLYEHFQINGLKEGRESSPFFNVNYYRSNNSDLATLTNQQAYNHFVNYGMKEGRITNASPKGDYAGNSASAKARNIALTANNTTFRDFVGSSDTNDYYSFTLKNESLFKLLLNGLSANANVDLVNNNGVVIQSSMNNGITAESINRNLGAGTYYIRVYPSDNSVNTNYNLTVSAPAVNEISLYNSAIVNTPNNQGWLTFGITPFPVAGGTQIASSSGTNLISTKSGSAGYSNYNSLTPTLVNSAFPTLNRNNGFTIRFNLKINSEAHNMDYNNDGIPDRAGFSVIALGSDNKGIELGFWQDEIWAQASGNNTLFTHDKVERAKRNTTVATNYDLTIIGDTYQLFANNSVILTGTVKDYSAFNHQAAKLPYDPYERQNFLFFGDNTSDANSNVNLGSIKVLNI